MRGQGSDLPWFASLEPGLLSSVFGPRWELPTSGYRDSERKHVFLEVSAHFGIRVIVTPDAAPQVPGIANPVPTDLNSGRCAE